MRENLAAGYPSPVRGAFDIGVLRTGLGGMGGHADYAPCSLHDLINKGYDYWALGHVHGYEGVCTNIRTWSFPAIFRAGMFGRRERRAPASFRWKTAKSPI